MGGSQLLLFWSRQDVIPSTAIYDVFRIDKNKNVFYGLITKTSDGITMYNNKLDGKFIEFKTPTEEDLTGTALPTLPTLVSIIDDTDLSTPEIDPLTEEFLRYVEQLSTRLLRP